MHLDKHCVKMILESCQLLSTAHRILDGKECVELSKTGRKVKRWKLDDERESVLYSATHINHPSAVWCRTNSENYRWLWNLLAELCFEYTYRYERTHLCEQSGLVTALYNLPRNINTLDAFTEPPPAMPDYCKVKNDAVSSYRNYYINEKYGFAKWTKRETPIWYVTKN